MNYSLLFLVSVQLLLVSSQFLTPLNSTRCSKSNLFASAVDENSHCVLGFPLQRTLDGAASSSHGIYDGASCFQKVCAGCTACYGIDWNPSTGMCSACYEDEVKSTFTQTGYTLFAKVVDKCVADSDCSTQHCDTGSSLCFAQCEESAPSTTCSIHDLGSDEDLIIPNSPVVKMIFDYSTQSFLFDVTTVYTRQQSSYVLGLDPFVDSRSIADVGLCENRNPDLFNYDNRNWWCSPSDAFGIGSTSHLAWGPSMSWNQTAKSCNEVEFKREFTINQLSKTCSKPGSVITTVTQKLIQYEGTFHVTLAQEDSDWSLKSLVPLAKWNFPFEFSFTRDFKIVSTLVSQKLSTKVKQGVSLFNGNRLAIFVDTRIADIYGPNAYVRLVSGMSSTNPLVIFPATAIGNGLLNGPQGTRTHQSLKRAADDNTPCVFPGCQQVWNFLSNAIPDTGNFAGVYSTTFEVWGSTQDPNRGIDQFTLTITIDPTFVPEKVSAIDNINLGSKLAIYHDPAFSVPPSPTGFRSSETIYISQAVNLAEEDRNLWKLDLQKVTICLVIDGTFGCKNAVENYVLVDAGVILADTYGFAAAIYEPGTISNNRFTSVVGVSFKALPLANKKPASRVFFVEFEAIASLANGQKRLIQQNAKVDDTLMLNVQDDQVIDTPALGDGSDKVGDNASFFSQSNTLMLSIGVVAVASVLVVIAISFFVFRYKLKAAEMQEHQPQPVDLQDVSSDEQESSSSSSLSSSI